jgi:uncharacterized protein YcbK (DUF882 family)
MNWQDYPNFSEAEFRCKHTGRCEMHPEFMAKLQRLRTAFEAPMHVSSGFRDPSHPVEASKRAGGEHTTGRAADIAIAGPGALRLIALAYIHGFNRIGVQQKGAGRFIHLGDSPDFPAGIWSY